MVHIQTHRAGYLRSIRSWWPSGSRVTSVRRMVTAPPLGLTVRLSRNYLTSFSQWLGTCDSPASTYWNQNRGTELPHSITHGCHIYYKLTQTISLSNNLSGLALLKKNTVTIQFLQKVHDDWSLFVKGRTFNPYQPSLLPGRPKKQQVPFDKRVTPTSSRFFGQTLFYHGGDHAPSMLTWILRASQSFSSIHWLACAI